MIFACIASCVQTNQNKKPIPNISGTDLAVCQRYVADKGNTNKCKSFLLTLTANIANSLMTVCLYKIPYILSHIQCIYK